MRSLRGAKFFMSTPILVVEDDNDLRLGICDLLVSEGYSVSSARDGREGWNVLQNHPNTKVILLDFTMPQLDARGFRELQRGNAKLAEIPVILFSAAVLTQSVLDSLAPNAVLRKPVDIDELLSVVKRFSA